MEEENSEIKKLGSSSPDVREGSTGSYMNNKPSGMSKPMVLVFGLIVLGLIGGAAFLLRDRLTGEQATPSPSPLVESPMIEPSPSASTFDRSKFTLRVLNGTKKSGLAASVSAKLKELGFQVEKTANASGSSHPRTIVSVKSDLSNLLEQLVKDLSGDFDASEGASLKSSDSADGEIILGDK